MSDMPMAEALRGLRQSTGMSQPEFAEYIASLGGDLPAGTISVVESGRRNISAKRLDQLADALQLSDAERDRLHHARQLQAARSLESATATRLADFEQRLASLERSMAMLLDAPDAQSAEVFDLAAAADKGVASKRGKKARRPSPEPEPEGP